MSEKRAAISWTAAKFKRFKRAQEKAREQKGKDGVFEFEGHQFLVSYGAYLIQFLSTLFNGE